MHRQRNILVLDDSIKAIIGRPVKVRQDSDSSRIIVRFFLGTTENRKLIKNYFIWIDPDYIVNSNLTNLTTNEIISEIIIRKFTDSNGHIPIEDGIYLNSSGEQIVNPRSFLHPLEQNE